MFSLQTVPKTGLVRVKLDFRPLLAGKGNFVVKAKIGPGRNYDVIADIPLCAIEGKFNL